MTRIENVLLRWGGKVMLLAIGVWVAAILGIFAGAWRLRWPWVLYFIATVIFMALVIQWTNAVRQRYIREAPLPRFLQRKLRETYPHLSTRDSELVERGLRQFFMACLRSNQQFVAMPSKAVDALWHEFILHTQAYKLWCQNALGFFLHHTPAEALGHKARHNDGLRRCWYWVCKEESIDPKAPSRLPCCLRWTPSSRLPEASATCPTAPTLPAKATRVAAAATATAAPVFRTAATAAARATLAGPRVRMPAVTAAGMAGRRRRLWWRRGLSAWSTDPTAPVGGTTPAPITLFLIATQA